MIFSGNFALKYLIIFFLIQIRRCFAFFYNNLVKKIRGVYSQRYTALPDPALPLKIKVFLMKRLYYYKKSKMQKKINFKMR